MSPTKKSASPASPRALASPTLSDAFMDFILSRQAMSCTPATLHFYNNTVKQFLLWAEGQGATSPTDINARLVRQFVAGLREHGKADRTLHAYSRAIKTLVKFWHKEGYIPSPIEIQMPKIGQNRLPVLDAAQLKTVIKASNVRDRAIVMFMADSGIRREEIIRLNWGDVDMSNGLVTVKQGKGKKDRVTVVGAATRRALLAYKRTVEHDEKSPLFQSRARSRRFTGTGLLLIFQRLSRKTGIHITAHAMRRTFVTLSLRAEMDVLHLQALLGHASLDMVYHYAQLSSEDLLRSHKAHSPVDSLV